MRRIISRIITGALILSFFNVGFIYAQTDKDGYVDTHTHLRIGTKQKGVQRGDMPGRDAMANSDLRKVRQRVGRVQNQSDTAVSYEIAAEELIAEMDKYNVSKAIVMPPPQIPGRHAGNYQDLVGLPRKYPGRIYFLGGGDVLNKLIHQYQPAEITPQIRAMFEKTAEQIISSGAKGFGEMSVLHLSLISSHHAFQEAAADHPLFLLLADIAARHNVPIDIHMEAVPQNIKTPEHLIKRSPQNPPTLHANIPAFERLLAHNRNAKIVWLQIGWDNTGYKSVDLLRRLLKAHPNLYLALRGEQRIYDRKTGQVKPNCIVGADWKVRPEWLKLISDFPDRLMAGTDNFCGEGASSYAKTSKETWSIVNQLPAELSRKVGRDNAIRIYNLE